MLNFDPNQVVIYALVFVLGLLVGGFLFTGGGRKWKSRYAAEVDRRKELEVRHVAAEKDWREQEKLHAAALKERPVVVERAPVVAPVAAAVAVPVIEREVTNDRTNEPLLATKKPSGVLDRMLGRDKDGDGFVDRNDGSVDGDGDGIDDRKEV